MSVDDAIRTELEELVRPVDDPDAIVAAVARRRDGLRRRRVPARAAAVAAVVVVAVGIGVALGGLPERDVRDVIADDPNAFQRSTVAVPPRGEVSAERLADGTPVWVAHHDDGTISVLDARSTHGSFELGELVGWCPTSQGFQEPAHGAVWDDRGRYRAGPAPTGLGRYPIGEVADGQVAVTGRARTQPRAIDGGQEATTGPDGYCLTGDESRRSPDAGAPLRLHAIGDAAMTLDEAMARPRGQVVAISGSDILYLPGRGGVVCQGGVERPAAGPPTCEGVDAPGLGQGSERDADRWFAASGPIIGRVGDGALHDVAFIGTWTARWGGVIATEGGSIDLEGTCSPHVRTYGAEAELLAATDDSDEHVAVCRIDAPAAAALAPDGRHYEIVVVGVLPDGTADVLRYDFRDAVDIPAPDEPSPERPGS